MSEEIDNRPKNAFEAAIDKATGYEPGDENRVVADAGRDGPAADETKQAEVKENAAPVKEKRDWVKDAYECFVKNAVDSDPTDPVKAIAAYFEKNATDELKAKAKAEGKTAEGCWKFIEAVARKALGGRSGHVDPVAVYAIAMHYFQDVPKGWDRVKKPARREAASVKTAKTKAGAKGKTAKVENPISTSKCPCETCEACGKDGRCQNKDSKTTYGHNNPTLVHCPKAKPKAEKERIKEKEKKQKAKKRGGEQGFFFDLMETETVGPDAAHGSAAGQDGKEAGDAK